MPNHCQKHNAIKVVVANGNNMDQIREGMAQSNKFPADMVDVQIFPIMSNRLIGACEIAKTGNTIIFYPKKS